MRYGSMITVIGIVCMIVLVAVFYVLFLNRGSDSVVPISFKVLAAVLAAAALLTIDLSKPPETLHSKTTFLIFRSANKELMDITPVTVGLSLPQWHAYNLLSQIWVFSGYTAQTEKFAMTDDVFDELLTATFLQWMANHYHLHWEMEHLYIAGISGGGGNASPKEDCDEDIAKYRFSDSANGFLRHATFNEIKLPKGSKAILQTSGHESVFTITNSHMAFTFKTLRLGNSGISHSILGDKIDARLEEPGSFYAHNYIVTISVKFSRFLRWSPQTNKQKEWMHQLFANFERDFNWDTFKPQFQTAIEELPEDKQLSGIPFKLNH